MSGAGGAVVVAREPVVMFGDVPFTSGEVAFSGSIAEINWL